MTEPLKISSRAGRALPAVDTARSALFLDIDGTLLDIAPRPDAVRVPGELPFDLAALTQCFGGALALVSGRPLATIDALFAPVRLPAIGSHGAEMRVSLCDRAEVTQADPVPAHVRAYLLDLVALDRRLVAEDKLYSVALHYRGAPRCEAALLERVNAVIAAEPEGSLRLLRGKCVVEVKTRGFDKGKAVRAVLRQSPFTGRQPVFVGDDRTDEEAFAVMPEFGGVCIAVGRRLAGAHYVMKDPMAVRTWLAGLARPKEYSA
jgi:trehalose 6-phosphate phosphatase